MIRAEEDLDPVRYNELVEIRSRISGVNNEIDTILSLGMESRADPGLLARSHETGLLHAIELKTRQIFNIWPRQQWM